ncbi:MFS transporter small subunit [Fibrivirga algicola]
MEKQEKTPILLIALAWITVTIPLLWGVSQTLLKALALFN